MNTIATIIGVAFFSFFFFLIGEPIIRGLLRFFGFYDVVREGTCHVYILFGKVAAVIKEPGLQWLWLKMGPQAFLCAG